MKRLVLISPLLAGFLLLANSDALPVLRVLVTADDYANIKSGDLIFRQGTDAVSAAVLASKAKSTYSHVGMIVVENEAVLVLHAVPAEAANEAGGVKLESINVFARSDRAAHVAIARPKTAFEVGAVAAESALKYQGRPFDAAFNLQDASEIYCTELVARAYFPLNINFYQKLQAVNFPLINQPLLLPQDVFEQAQLIKVLVR